MAFKKKILHFIESGGLYGAENVILNLSKEMIEDGQYEPVVGCIVQSKNEESELFDKAQSFNIETIRIVINNKRFPLDILLAAFHLKRREIGLIHSHGYKPSVVGFIIHLLIGIPVIATCHLWFLKSDSPLKYRVMTSLEAFFYRFFPKIIAVSEQIKQCLVKRKDIDEEKILIIKNGINLKCYSDFSEKEVSALRNQLKLNKKFPVILNLGRLTEQKAQKNIILAANILKEKGIKSYFLIAGDGELRDYLQSLISEHSLTNEVRLLGFRDDVINLLHLADIFILASLDEGLPISLLEAMAMKKPIICTPVGEIPEVISDGQEGFLIPTDNIEAIVHSIINILNDPAKKEKIINKAYIKVKENFSISRMFKAYDDVYTSLLYDVPNRRRF